MSKRLHYEHGQIFRLQAIFPLAAAFVWFAQPVAIADTVKPIATGVTLTEEIDTNPPELIHIMTVDLSRAGVHVAAIPGQDTVTGPTGDIHQGREQVRLTADRHGAVAAVNGDFFPLTGDPLGAAVWNGNLYSEPYPTRCAMGIESDGHTVLFDTLGFLGELQTLSSDLTKITGIDRYVSSTDLNDIVVFTPTFGPKSGIRPGGAEVVLTGVNLPLSPSKLLVGTVTAINTSAAVGSAIPNDGIILGAAPGGPAATFLTKNMHVGEKAEIVCAIAPTASLTNAIELAMAPRDASGLPIQSGTDTDQTAYAWSTVSEVIGGGPHLVVDGKVAVDGSAEQFEDAFINQPNPRTGVGVTADGKLLLVTVDGRQTLSKGMTLPDFANLMLRLGAVNAMNLDGGGSTTMTADGLVVNSIASTGYERPVANSLCVFSPDPFTPPIDPLPTATDSVTPEDATEDDGPSIAGISGPMKIGQARQLCIRDGAHRIDGSSQSIVWGGCVGLGIGFVSQSGLLTALQTGSTGVTAYYKGQLLRVPLSIIGPPALTEQNTITATITTPNDRKPLQTVVDIGVCTDDGTAVAQVKLHLTAAGGVPMQTDLVTDEDGYAETNITWSGKNGTITINSDGLNSKTIQQP
jgi:exopolysaccharide biosynthesis protein